MNANLIHKWIRGLRLLLKNLMMLLRHPFCLLRLRIVGLFHNFSLHSKK